MICPGLGLHPFLFKFLAIALDCRGPIFFFNLVVAKFSPKGCVPRRSLAVFDQTAHAGRGRGEEGQTGMPSYAPRFLQLLTHHLHGEAAWAHTPSWVTPQGTHSHEAESQFGPAARPWGGSSACLSTGSGGRGVHPWTVRPWRGQRPGLPSQLQMDGLWSLPAGRNRPPSSPSCELFWALTTNRELLSDPSAVGLRPLEDKRMKSGGSFPRAGVPGSRA